VKFYKQKILRRLQKNYNSNIECSVNKASNEIMLHRISGGKDIEFPFSSITKE